MNTFEAVFGVALVLVMIRYPKLAILAASIGAGVFTLFWVYMIVAMYTQTGPYRIGE